MGFVLESARKDARRRLADPVAVLMYVGIPLLIGGLMTLVAGGFGGGGGPRATVLVADGDGTFLTELLTGRAFGEGGPSELGGVLEVVPVEAADGRARMDAGEASGLIVIPDGFTEALLREEETTLELVTNPAQRIVPALLREALEVLVEAAFYAQRLAGEPLRTIVDGPPDGADFFADARVAELAGTINARVRGLEGVLFPPVLKLEAAPDDAPEEEPADPTGGMGLAFLPGILMMSILFWAQGMSDDLWQEARAGTLRRALVAPPALGAFLAGKLLAGAFFVACVSVVGLAVAVLGLGADPLRAPLALAWCTFVGAALLALFFFVASLAGSQRGANVLTTVLVFPLMMLGGCFFPFEAMPAWMVSIGSWTPNGVAVLRLKEMLGGELDLGATLYAALQVGVPGAVAFALCLARARRRFAAA